MLEGRDIFDSAQQVSSFLLLLCLQLLCYFVFTRQRDTNIEQENSVNGIHSLQGHDLNETRFTLVSNIVNKSCVVRKASHYPGQSQGSFHQKYNNLTITLFYTASPVIG